MTTSKNRCKARADIEVGDTGDLAEDVAEVRCDRKRGHYPRTRHHWKNDTTEAWWSEGYQTQTSTEPFWSSHA